MISAKDEEVSHGLTHLATTVAVDLRSDFLVFKSTSIFQTKCSLFKIMRGQNRRGYRNIEGRLSLSSHSSHSSPRQTHVTNLRPAEIKVVQDVVDGCYVATDDVLNLSNFSKNTEFVERDMLMCLTKTRVMSVVLQHIGYKYPRISGISFSV